MPAVLLAIILFLFSVTTPAPALQEADVAPLPEGFSWKAELIPLSLQDSICLALTNNIDIETRQYLPRIDLAAIESQKGLFDPHIYANATYVDTTVPLPASTSVQTGGLTAVKAKQWLITGGVTGAIISGLTYDASITSEHTPSSTITDFFGTRGQQRFTVVLTVSQPLLKNFGTDVNMTGIRVAEITKEASVYQLEQTVMDTLFAVENAYWNLVFTYENLRVKLNSLKLSQDLLKENRIRLEVGVVSSLDVLQSETGVASREEDVILAQRAVEAASDTLIALINLYPGESVWSGQILPTDEAIIAPPAEYVEGQQIALAMKNRPELQALIKQQEAAALQVKYTRNQLLPSLNLNASVGSIGLDYDFNSSFLTETPVPPFPHTGVDRAFDDLTSGDNLQWGLGLTFEMPLGEHFERGQYKTANLQLSQIDTSIQSLRLTLIQDVRGALRQVQTLWEEVNATHVTTEFRRQSLQAEYKKYQVGATTTFDLLQFENELAVAQALEMVATTQYKTAQANLRRATGTLLDHLNVRMEVDP